jgi:hypothetical protein
MLHIHSSLSRPNPLVTSFYVRNRQGVRFIQVKLIKLSDIGTIFKVCFIQDCFIQGSD